MLTGNREFNEVYEKYKNLVLRVAYIYSGNNIDAAQDIYQDTMFKLYVGFEKLKDGNIYSWLYTTAKNAAINFKKKSDREVLTEDENILNYKTSYHESTENEYLDHDLNKRKYKFEKKVLEGIRKKNSKWYDAFILVYYMDMPQAKAAEILGMKINVLHSMLHRAKEWTKKQYGVEYEEIKRGE